jgi:uncharacterized protein YdeI (YjbR/CyaY-like superfamily)
VDEALCVGWIDGIRRSMDAESYTIRFTPRRPRSVWSNVNIRRGRELEREGRILPAGKKAFEARRENRSGIYSYEQRKDRLAPPFGAALKKSKAASAFFDAQPPGYRKTAGWWVVSAKKDETRWKRFGDLVKYCEQGKRIPGFTPLRPARKKAKAK